ncbi:MAG: hypothetical protein SGARI_007907, partial [Bacillariaceae sp.]
GHRETGAFVTLSCDIVEWTADLHSLEQSNGRVANGHSNEPLGSVRDKDTDTLIGLLVIIINRAFDLPLDRKTANTFVKATFCGNEYDSNVVCDYPGYYDGLNPAYDSAFTIPLSADMDIGDHATIQLDLLNTGSGDKAMIVGSTSINIGDLKKNPENTITETRILSPPDATIVN